MKRFSVLILILALVCGFALLVSCSDDVSSAQAVKSRQYAGVNFVNDSKSLGSSVNGLDDFGGAENLYWRYTAVMSSKVNAAGTQTDETPVKADGSKGLGVVEGFEVGTWTFKLVGYGDAEFTKAVFESSEVQATLQPNTVSEITFPVKRAQIEGQLGTLIIDMDNISFEGAGAGEEYELLAVTLFAADGSEAGTLSSETSMIELEPGTYMVILDFKYHGYSYVAYMDGVEVYSNNSTMISGVVEGKQTATYNITYKDKGGSAYSGNNLVSLRNKHKYGAPTPLTAGTKNYFTFDGWSMDSEWSDPIVTIPAERDDDTVLYASWTPITYTITYDYNALLNNQEDASLVKPANPVSYDYTSSTITLSNEFKRTGFEFLSWTSGTDSETSQTTMEIPEGTAGNLNFKVNWREYAYNIHFDPNFASATNAQPDTMHGEMTDMENISYTQEVNLTKNGFSVDGWKFKYWVFDDGSVVTGGDEALVSKLTDTDMSTVNLRASWVQKGDNEYTVEHYFEELDGSYTLDAVRDTVTEALADTDTDALDKVREVEGYKYSEDVSSATNKGRILNDNTLVLKLYYPRNVWSLTWDFDGGKEKAASQFTTTGDYKYEAPVTYPEVEKDGYTFIGWILNNGTDVSATEDLPAAMPNSNLPIKAKWEANKYKVSFNKAGEEGSTEAKGEMADENFVFDENAKALSANLFTKEGYEFVHWHRTDVTTSTTFTDGANVRNLTTASDGVVTLDAVWTPNHYTVHYNSNKPATASKVIEGDDVEDQERIFDADDEIVSDNTWTLEGWTFKYWTTSSDGNGTHFTTGSEFGTNLTSVKNGDVTLYAHWEPNEYSIIFDGNENGDTRVDYESRSAVSGSTDSQSMTYDETPRKLNDCGFTRTGYTFVGWSTASDAIPDDDVNTIYNTTTNYNNFSSGSDVTMYAIWKMNTYTVKVEVEYYDEAANGSRTKNTTEVFGSVDKTSLTNIEYKAKLSHTDFTLYAIDVIAAGDQIITATPETSTTDYAYYFDGFTGADETSVEGEITVKAIFVRKAQPKVTPDVKLPTHVVIDYKGADLVNYEKASLGSVDFYMLYGTTADTLDSSVFGGCVLEGYELEGLYLDKECTNKLMSFDGGDVVFENNAGYVEYDAWIKVGGEVKVFAKWTVLLP